MCWVVEISRRLSIHTGCQACSEDHQQLQVLSKPRKLFIIIIISIFFCLQLLQQCSTTFETTAFSAHFASWDCCSLDRVRSWKWRCQTSKNSQFTFVLCARAPTRHLGGRLIGRSVVCVYLYQPLLFTRSSSTFNTQCRSEVSCKGQERVKSNE